MLSIPRDFFVPIAGTGSSNRINVAFGPGPGQLVRTISQALGITVNHYMQEDFNSLQQLTDAVGGVCMNFTYPVRDGAPTGHGNESGLDIATAGHHTLTGTDALALVRSRYYQYFEGGSWKAEGTGDIGRIERQHVFMRALAAKLVHAALANPLTANAVLARAVHDVSVDDSFSTNGILRLALHLRSLRPTDMPSWTLPYRAVNGYGSYGDVLMPDPPQDAQVIAAWQSYGAPSSGGPPPATTVALASVTVRVLNGSGTAGQAQRTADGLAAAGFKVADVGTAPSSAPAASSSVAYGPGHQVEARTLAAHLQGPVTVSQDASLKTSTLVLTTGSNLVEAPSGPTASSVPPSTAIGRAAPDAAKPPAWDPTPC